MKAAAVQDYRELARRRLPHFLFEYIDGGSYAEVTARRNIADLESVALRQRVLRDVSALDLTTKLFGEKLAMPVALGPIGIAGLNARRGETQAVRAAEAAGVPWRMDAARRSTSSRFSAISRALMVPPTSEPRALSRVSRDRV